MHVVFVYLPSIRIRKNRDIHFASPLLHLSLPLRYFPIEFRIVLPYSVSPHEEFFRSNHIPIPLIEPSPSVVLTTCSWL